MADTIQGTSIEDIELGNVENAADEQKMQEILADMNMETQYAPQYAPQEAPRQAPRQATRQTHMQAMPPMRAVEPMLPRRQMAPQFEDEYEPEHEMEPEPEKPKYKVAKKVKRNKWSFSFDGLMDPLVVGILVCLLSLPVLHTWGGKHLTWAYKMGGELSWYGLLVVGALGAGLFALYQFITEHLT